MDAIQVMSAITKHYSESKKKAEKIGKVNCEDIDFFGNDEIFFRYEIDQQDGSDDILVYKRHIQLSEANYTNNIKVVVIKDGVNYSC